MQRGDPSSVAGVIKKAVNELTKEMAAVGKKEGDDKAGSLLQDGHSENLIARLSNQVLQGLKDQHDDMHHFKQYISQKIP